MRNLLKREVLCLLGGIALAATMVAACGGGGSKKGSETPRATTAATVASGAATVPPVAESECTVDSPKNLGSTSHEVNVATTKQVIEMEWDAPSTPPASYSYAFSQNPQEPPDVMESLPGDATSVSSGPMGQNRWYFYLVQDGGNTGPTRCGPYVITREGNGGGGGGSGDEVTLTISASGGSSVEYFTNRGERLFCGDTTVSLHDVTCSARFIRGSEARVQRTLGLPVDEEVRWRLSLWGGACEELDADTEPRGGQCTLTMDEDKDVSVSFEARAKLTIMHTGPSQLFLRWGVDFAPRAQKGGGNPLTLAGTFDCDTDTLAACEKSGYYDTGTHITVTAGTGVDSGNLASISGACSTAASTCEFDIATDAEVTFNWKY